MTRLAILVAIGLTVAGCSDSAARRQATAERIRRLQAQVEANPENDRALREIIQELDGSYQFGRTYAASALGELDVIAVPAIPALIRGLDSGDPHVERECAIALSKMGTAAASAVPVLIKKSGEVDRDVGWFSAEALGNIGEPAVDALPELRRHRDLVAPAFRSMYSDAITKLESLQNEAASTERAP